MTTPLPVKAGPMPARCMPDADQFWSLESRVSKLEEDMPYVAPHLARAFAPFAFLVLLTFGVCVSLVAFAVALPWALS